MLQSRYITRYVVNLSDSLQMKQPPALLRKFLAELLGTFVLVLFGDGAIAQLTLMAKADFTAVSLVKTLS
jgi:hypothetical protein